MCFSLLWYADTLSLFQTWLECPGPSYLNLLIVVSGTLSGGQKVCWLVLITPAWCEGEGGIVSLAGRGIENQEH